MNRLEYNEKVKLLSTLDHDDFTRVCSVNREFAALCSGKLSSKIILVYGDLTEEIYTARCHNFFDESILSFHPEEMSWKEFYDRIVRMNSLLETNYSTILLKYYLENDMILEANILQKILIQK